MKEMKKDWWKDAVIYQIYPKSFQDSNGDGIGDIPGIISRLDYLKDLGIDAIWLSPVYRSPQDDNGYDISDYQDVDPMFGDIHDMEQLIKEADKRNIKIIMDLVLNHTSDEHRWFQEAKKSKDNPYHDYYVWRDGEEGTYPNKLGSVFGGPAWEWVPELGQYYFHQFSVKQPDLNWDNPKVRRELYDMILWWMDKGVGGFRLDVIDQIAKEPDDNITINGPRLHEFIQEMSKETFQKGNLITVGEAWGATPERAKLYSNPDGSEFSMVFQFEHIMLDQKEEKWDVVPLPLPKLKKCYEKWQKTLYKKGWNSLFMDNHDLPRIVSRWGDDGKYREESAKMLAVMLHGMQGTPYIYQGEELGMTNVKFKDISDYEDIETLNMYKERIEKGYAKEDIMKSLYARSRDNARTPMHWNAGKNAGFTDGEAWMKMNPNYTQINAEQELQDENSVYHFYQKLIALRKENAVFVDGDFELLLPDDEKIFAYVRSNEDTEMLVCTNFSKEHVEWPVDEDWKDAEILIHNYEGELTEELRPYEAVIMKRKKRTQKKRKSGMLMPISALPGAYGIGCFSQEAYKFVDVLKESGQSLWQILPLGQTGYGDSPYQSFSTFAGNPYFIDLETLIEDELLTKAECDQADFGDNEEEIDYEKMYHARFKILKLAYERAKKSGLLQSEAYQEYLKEEWLADYALYMAVKDSFGGKSWDQWDEDIRLRKPEAMKAYQEKLASEVEFYEFLQYLFAGQWAGLKEYANAQGIEIIGDIPIYVAFDSADTWANPKLFQLDEENLPVAVAGCPPDAFSETGQLWGNPLYAWEYHKKTGYDWWMKRVAHCFKLYDVIRIDHFRGFDEYYAIPYGDKTAENGKWMPGPGMDLFRTMKEKLGDLPIIAEDLGFLTDTVKELLKDSGYPGMKVLQFAFNAGQDSEYLPHNYEKNCVVYTGTHDNDTLQGWYQTLSEEDKEMTQEYLNNPYTPEENVHWDFISLAMRSVADTCIIPAQDFLGLGNEARINLPSTLGGNWMWRMKKDAFTDELIEKIRKMTEVYAR